MLTEKLSLKVVDSVEREESEEELKKRKEEMQHLTNNEKEKGKK